MFHQLVISDARRIRTQKPWTVAISAVAQAAGVAILILAPLLYTEALPNAMLRMMIVAPPPPAPVFPAPQARNRPRVRVIPLSHIVAPTHIPSHIITGADIPPAIYVDDQVAANSEGDELLTTIVSPPPERPTSPPVAEMKQRIRVGGNVEAAAIVARVVPKYPEIAKLAHISGTVILHAVIATDGTVQELSYVSGPSLLIKAAMDAVREWRYRPTLLNQMPVEVDTTIEVVFNLAGS